MLDHLTDDDCPAFQVFAHLMDIAFRRQHDANRLGHDFDRRGRRRQRLAVRPDLETLFGFHADPPCAGNPHFGERGVAGATYAHQQPEGARPRHRADDAQVQLPIGRRRAGHDADRPLC